MRPVHRGFAATGCVLAMGALVPVALYQCGLLDRLPDPPGAIFASERIVSSKAAHPLGVPDSLPGLASYGTTLLLIVLANRSRVAQRLLGVKLVGDAGLAGFNVVRQLVSFRKICSWCTGAAAATALTVYAGREAVADTADLVRGKV